MTDRYGPWTVHTPGECPVPPETMVQPMSEQITLREAELVLPVKASSILWDYVRFYRVLLEPEWKTVHVGCEPLGALHRILVPVIDGKPDFSRQPKWEEV